MAVYDPFSLEPTPPSEDNLLKRYPAFAQARQEYHNFFSSSSGQSPAAMAAWQKQSASLEEAYHSAYASAHRSDYTQRQGPVASSGAPVSPAASSVKSSGAQTAARSSSGGWPGRLGYENFWTPGAGGGMPYSAPTHPLVNLNVSSNATPTLSSVRATGVPSSGSSFSGLNLNVSGGPTQTLRDMPAYQPLSPGTVGPGRRSTPINNALRNGKGVMSKVPFGRPGLLMTAIGAGTAGAVMGNGDFSSFAMGAGAGLVGGHAAEAASSAVYAGLTSYGRKNAGQMSESAFKAVNMGRMMTAKSGRGMIFGGGALLAGGLFSSMFASNSKSYKQGFNANRGNSIVR